MTIWEEESAFTLPPGPKPAPALAALADQLGQGRHGVLFFLRAFT